uniref:AlNc14C40G3429 protein n=1 Tax=Albugo laibachii Nc14 TaxID=890382 RepID=F0W9H0_9STRA|nr:AlNc14C40G3429 [Albugo laibachii Nc14]|eukprot:CCA17784.1 AlNc14C40G3429 [Albugo laibachii Nc14]
MEQMASWVEAEYEADTELKREILREMGIEEEHLSINGRLYLRILTETATLLQLKDVHTSSYLTAITDLEERVGRGEEQALELQIQMEQRLIQQRRIQADLERLHAAKEHLELASQEREAMEHSLTMEKRCDEAGMELDAKQNELLALENSLKQLGFHEIASRYIDISSLPLLTSLCSCDHDTIVQLENELNMKEHAIQELRQQLQEFQGLPLDLDQAKSELARATEELRGLELQFDQKIQEMI